MSKLYLHDKECVYVGTNKFGTFVDCKGVRHCVFSHGALVRNCLLPAPVRPATVDCPNCDWTASPVYACGGSCGWAPGQTMMWGKR